jgi:integrase/recombinase XerD
VLDLLRSRFGPTTPELLPYFREFLSKEVSQKKLSGETEKKYDCFYNNLERFLQSKKLTKITLNQVRIAHMDQFTLWMHKTLHSCSNTHASKHIEAVKRCMSFAVRDELIPFNPIAEFETKRDKVKPVVWISSAEIERLKAAKFESDIYNLHRDYYLYQCYTGLSYMDIWKHEIKEEKGIMWVTCEQGRGKTSKLYWAEFTPEAKEIRDKYNGVFPRTENRVYNRIIKEIMAQVGVKKHITTHTGRKTFATLKDQEGYSLAAIAGMLGNTEEITRRHYVDPTLEKVRREVIRVKGERSLKIVG